VRSGAGATGDDLFGHSRRLSASWWPGAHCQDICNNSRLQNETSKYKHNVNMDYSNEYSKYKCTT